MHSLGVAYLESYYYLGKLYSTHMIQLQSSHTQGSRTYEVSQQKPHGSQSRWVLPPLKMMKLERVSFSNNRQYYGRHKKTKGPCAFFHIYPSSM